MEQIAALKDALGKAEAKEKRLVAQLEAAQREREELETAIRVIERFANAPASTSDGGGQSENGQLIYGYVKAGIKNAMAPKEIIDLLKADGHDLGDDLVRTQLWRMAKRKELRKEDGRYFRPDITEESIADLLGGDDEKAPGAKAAEALEVGRVAELDGPQKTEQRPFRKGENVGSSPTPPASTFPPMTPNTDMDWVEDDDIPF